MTCLNNWEGRANEVRLQEAIKGIKSSCFKSTYYALKEMPDIPRSTLYTRLNGTMSRNKAHKDQQHLLHAEEHELVKWISQMMRINHAPSHPLVCHMAEHIRSHHLQNITDKFMELIQYESLGEQWVTHFMTRHSYLQTILPQPIEEACVKESSYEALSTYFDRIHDAIKEYNIHAENMYNMNESGFAIDVIEASKVIVDTKAFTNSIYHQSQLGQQE